MDASRAGTADDASAPYLSTAFRAFACDCFHLNETHGEAYLIVDPAVSCGRCSVQTGEVFPDVEGEHVEVLAVRRIARFCIAIYAIGVPLLYLILLLTILPELREVTAPRF